MRKLLLLTLLFISQQSFATDRYTTPGGAASGTCPIGTPCTILRVTSAAQSGDTVFIGAGTYSEGLNTGNINVTYTCPTGLGTCIINGLASGTTDRAVKIDVNGITFEKMIVMTPALDGTAHKYGITIESGVTGAIVQNNNVTSDGTSSTSDLTFNQWGIFARGTGFLVTNNKVNRVQIGISANTDVGIPTGTISYNTITTMDMGDEEDADCISIGSTARDMSYELIIEYNDCSGFRDDGIDMLSSSNTIVRYNYIHGSAESTTANSGIKAGRETSSGNRIYGNFIDVRGGNSTGTYCMVVPGLSSGGIFSNIMLTDTSQTCVEMSEWTVTPFGGGDNNTFYNNIMQGNLPFYNRSNATGNLLKNNVLIGTTADIKTDAGTTVTGTKNALSGTGTSTGSGTYSGTGDITTKLAALGFFGGTSPTTKEGFRLKSSSALKRTGTYLNIGNFSDAYNRAFSNPPSIGAIESASGDEASSRIPRD